MLPSRLKSPATIATGAVVDAQTVAGRRGQTELRVGEAAAAVGDQDGEAVRRLD